VAVLDHEEHDRLGHGVGDGPMCVCMYVYLCIYIYNLAILTAVWQCLTMKSMTALGTALETERTTVAWYEARSERIRVASSLFTCPKKQSLSTDARANNALHKYLGYPIKEPTRQSACEARP